MTSSQPLLSILIPTRERAHRLRYTLQTALQPGSSPYEVIISDNDSQDGTRQVVEEFADPRIRYFNTGARLNMCDNFEFALNQAKGRYVIAIGDDDAFIPGALQTMAEVIERHPASAYFWAPDSYRWPSEGKPAFGYVRAGKVQITEMDLIQIAKKSMRWGGVGYNWLPRLYHSPVSRDALDALRERTGRVFHSTAPDVFLSYALPPLIRTALNLGTAMTVNGISEVRPMTPGEQERDPKSAYARRTRRFFSEYSGYQMHDILDPNDPELLNLYPDAILKSIELFPKVYQQSDLNFSAMWAYRVTRWKYRSILEIVRNRKALRQDYSFRVVDFLFRTLCFNFATLRASNRLVPPSEQGRWERLFDTVWRRIHRNVAFGTCPENIAEFVQQFYGPQEVGHHLPLETAHMGTL
ncbi:MAG: glycosyltransferase family 2 protein [Candidatus Paceibacterota bacterium]